MMNKDIIPRRSSQSGNLLKGACQYKTGKCLKERAVKRNGELHSLCEEHRLKQNLIQRRSDRKYQSVHAQKRRHKSQQKALFRKQLSMAMAQDVIYRNPYQPPFVTLNMLSSVHAASPLATPMPSPVGVQDFWTTEPPSETNISSSDSSSNCSFTVESFFNSEEGCDTLPESIMIDDIDASIPVLEEHETSQWSIEDLNVLHEILEVN